MLKNIFLLLAMALATASFAQKRGIAIGDDVRVRSSASTKGSILRELERGDVVDVLRVKDDLEAVSSDDEYCDWHHWINVKLSDGTTGWIYGEYLQTFDLSDSYGSYTIAGERFTLYVTEYQGAPAFADDITGCSEIRFPILIPKNTPNKGHVLLNKTTYYSDNEGYGYLANMHFYKEKYWVLTDDDGWGMELKKEGVESMGTLLLDLRVTGQDTYEGLTVVEISKDTYGRMIAKGVSYQRQ